MPDLVGIMYVILIIYNLIHTIGIKLGIYMYNQLEHVQLQEIILRYMYVLLGKNHFNWCIRCLGQNSLLF